MGSRSFANGKEDQETAGGGGKREEREGQEKGMKMLCVWANSPQGMWSLCLQTHTHTKQKF